MRSRPFYSGKYIFKHNFSAQVKLFLRLHASVALWLYIQTWNINPNPFPSSLWHSVVPLCTPLWRRVCRLRIRQELALEPAFVSTANQNADQWSHFILYFCSSCSIPSREFQSQETHTHTIHIHTHRHTRTRRRTERSNAKTWACTERGCACKSSLLVNLVKLWFVFMDEVCKQKHLQCCPLPSAPHTCTSLIPLQTEWQLLCYKENIS